MNKSKAKTFFGSSLKMGEVRLNDGSAEGEPIQLELTKYNTPHGSPKAIAIQAYSMNFEQGQDYGYPEPYGRLSVNVVGLHLAPWEVAIKDWSENVELAHGSLKSRFFDPKVRQASDATTVAKINPGSLPPKTLSEVAHDLEWDISALDLVESIARELNSESKIVMLDIHPDHPESQMNFGVEVKTPENGELAFRVWDDPDQSRDVTDVELAQIKEALKIGTGKFSLVADLNTLIFRGDCDSTPNVLSTLDDYIDLREIERERSKSAQVQQCQ